MSGALEARLSRLEAQHKPKTTKPAKIKPPSPLAFVESLKIEDKDTGGLVGFRLWPAQKRMLRGMVANDRLILLKARQLGASWLALAYMLYLATFEPGQLFLVARQSLEESGEAIHRLRVLNDSMPERWRQPATTDNVFSLGLANGSRIRALSSSKAIGRGLSARYVIADELAFWTDPETQLAALEPGAHRLHVISTGNGPYDFFHSLWLKSLSGEGRWRSEFYSWSAHPARKGSWYKDNVTDAPSPSLAKREYASKPEDAFLSPAGIFFERFDSTRNVADVAIVPAWQTFRCVDFGFRSPACAWAQQAPSGQLFIVAELVPHNKTTTEFANLIVRTDTDLGVKPRLTYVDPAGRAANVQTAESEVDLFRRSGLSPVSKGSSIRDGCVRLMDLLADPAIPLVISKACPWIIAGFSTIRPDKHSPEVYDESSDYTHILDALRYLVVNRAVRQVARTFSSGGRPITAGMIGMRF